MLFVEHSITMLSVVITPQVTALKLLMVQESSFAALLEKMFAEIQKESLLAVTAAANNVAVISAVAASVALLGSKIVVMVVVIAVAAV